MSGVAITTSKSVKPSCDVLGEVLGADDVRAGLLGLARLVALGEDGDRDVLAQPVRQRDRAAQLLVGVADVEARAHVDLDGLVELRRCEVSLTSEIASAGSYSFSRSIFAARVEVLLAVLGHQPVTSTPMDRAVPSMIFDA